MLGHAQIGDDETCIKEQILLKKYFTFKYKSYFLDLQRAKYDQLQYGLKFNFMLSCSLLKPL